MSNFFKILPFCIFNLSIKWFSDDQRILILLQSKKIKQKLLQNKQFYHIFVYNFDVKESWKH